MRYICQLGFEIGDSFPIMLSQLISPPTHALHSILWSACNGFIISFLIIIIMVICIIIQWSLSYCLIIINQIIFICSHQHFFKLLSLISTPYSHTHALHSNGYTKGTRNLLQVDRGHKRCIIWTTLSAGKYRTQLSNIV